MIGADKACHIWQHVHIGTGGDFQPQVASLDIDRLADHGIVGCSPSWRTGKPRKRWCMAVLPTTTASVIRSGSGQRPRTSAFSPSTRTVVSRLLSSRDGIRDPAHDILAVRDLWVRHAVQPQRGSRLHVYQVGGDFRGPDIDCQPQWAAVGRADVDDLCPALGSHAPATRCRGAARAGA